jgi:hypothetical protein
MIRTLYPVKEASELRDLRSHSRCRQVYTIVLLSLPQLEIQDRVSERQALHRGNCRVVLT